MNRFFRVALLVSMLAGCAAGAQYERRYMSTSSTLVTSTAASSITWYSDVSGLNRSFGGSLTYAIKQDTIYGAIMIGAQRNNNFNPAMVTFVVSLTKGAGVPVGSDTLTFLEDAYLAAATTRHLTYKIYPNGPIAGASSINLNVRTIINPQGSYSIRWLAVSRTYDPGPGGVYHDDYFIDFPVDSCSVVYQGNGNTGGSVPIDGVRYPQNATITVLGNTGSLVKTDFTFAGWNTASDGSGTGYSGGASFNIGTTTNAVLYAQWSPNNPFSVSFDKNDAAATGTMGMLTINSGYSANLTANSFVKSGWYFTGWATTSAGPVAYADRALYTMGTANATLYAKWLIYLYVLYYANGGSGGPSAGQYKEGALATVSYPNLGPGPGGMMPKPGHNFTGWNTAADGSGTAYSPGATFIMGSANVALYAQWTPATIFVFFDKNDAAATGTMQSQGILYGTPANLNPNLYTKTGWSFAGWATTPAGAVAYADGAPYTMGSTSVTLYAKWTINSYTLTFDKNDAAAAGTMSSQTITYGSSVTLPNNSFVKPGWTFTGWGTGPGGPVAYANAASFTMGPSDDTLYAQWTPNLHTITFDKNDAAASGTMGTQAIYCGSSAKLYANTFVKTGWHFGGWATWPGGAAAYADTALYTMGVITPVVLYATWTLNTYTLTLAHVLGNGAPVNDTVTVAQYGDTVRISAAAISGSVFTKWTITAGTAVLIDSTSQQAKVVLISGNATVTALYDNATMVKKVPSALPAAFNFSYSSKSSMFHIAIPGTAGMGTVPVHIRLFDMRGRLLTTLANLELAPGFYTMIMPQKNRLAYGSCMICCIDAKAFCKTVKVLVGR
jgi:uncharacterized repeat protein (TIGR02543 family)